MDFTGAEVEPPGCLVPRNRLASETTAKFDYFPFFWSDLPCNGSTNFFELFIGDMLKVIVIFINMEKLELVAN